MFDKSETRKVTRKPSVSSWAIAEVLNIGTVIVNRATVPIAISLIFLRMLRCLALVIAHLPMNRHECVNAQSRAASRVQTKRLRSTESV